MEESANIVVDIVNEEVKVLQLMKVTTVTHIMVLKDSDQEGIISENIMDMDTKVIIIIMDMNMENIIHTIIIMDPDSVGYVASIEDLRVANIVKNQHPSEVVNEENDQNIIKNNQRWEVIITDVIHRSLECDVVIPSAVSEAEKIQHQSTPINIE